MEVVKLGTNMSQFTFGDPRDMNKIGNVIGKTNRVIIPVTEGHQIRKNEGSSGVMVRLEYNLDNQLLINGDFRKVKLDDRNGEQSRTVTQAGKGEMTIMEERNELAEKEIAIAMEMDQCLGETK
ncbi:hypothetical protein ACH5RR_023189 [Cinchona calisaya]|uniref:Uncharacterized protein n=1 Tax=Cinchona calisaya TaxID=153742 RepID=A0ABD2ZDU9_9GENT